MTTPNAFNTSGTAKATSSHSPREIVSSLISSIPAPETPQQEANPLKALSDGAKNIFLTLYALFGNELLPALDLLDRGLVTRLLVTRPAASSNGAEAGSAQPARRVDPPITYLVRSAQQHSSRNAAYEHVNHYEVRLQAWSCSCPAFTFSAFPASVPATPGARQDVVPASVTRQRSLFGGLTRGVDIAVCKHMLACVLVEHCGMFAHFVNEREVSKEEMAGWAAGWGD